MEKEPELLNYWDYRKYLQDFYLFKKKTRSGYSYRVFCKEAGIKSASHFKMVIDGQRNVTPKSLPKFLKGLRIENEDEKKLFSLMVEYTQEKDIEPKAEIFRNLITLKNKEESVPMEYFQLSFLTSWHTIAIYVLIETNEFKSDVEWISKKLKKKVSNENILKAIKNLVELNLIKKDTYGNYVQTKGSIVTPTKFDRNILDEYYSIMGAMAIQSLGDDDEDNRFFNGATISINRKNIQAFAEKIKKFRAEINEMSLSNLDSNDDVYQLNVQFFPLTKRT